MYIYEMHQHTAGCSACAHADPAETVRALKAEGFAGMVLTNHFYHGNTGINRHLPWEDFVRPYEEAYLAALAEGEKLDFDVLFGIEEGLTNPDTGGYSGKEVLLYGITPAFLYAHPELRDADLPVISRLVHEAGALVVQAHPFRVRDYIPEPWKELPASYLDGIETYNASNGALENARAEAFAEREGLFAVAGSDAHGEHFPHRYGIACEHRLTDEAALAATLRDGDYSLYIPE